MIIVRRPAGVAAFVTASGLFLYIFLFLILLIPFTRSGSANEANVWRATTTSAHPRACFFTKQRKPGGGSTTSSSSFSVAFTH